MKTRICPLCDQPMKKKHYCDSCKSFVLHPWYMDLNPGRTEEDWTELDEERYRKDITSSQSYSNDTYIEDDGSKLDYNSSDFNDSSYTDHSYVEDSVDEKQSASYYNEALERRKHKSKLSKLIKIVVLVIVLLEVVPIVIGGLLSIFEEVRTEETPNYYEDFRELTDEEAIALGEECNGKTHFDITYEDFLTAAQPGLTNAGVYFDDYSDASYNKIVEGDDAYTTFDYDRMYFMDDEKGNYFDLSWDTVSGRVHEIHFSVYDETGVRDMLAAILPAIGEDPAVWAENVEAGLEEAVEDDYSYFEIDTYEIDISFTEAEYEYDNNAYYISINKMNQSV